MVMADEMPAGIFTERDLIRCRILFPDKQTDQVTIDKVMTSKLIVAEPQDSVDAAMAMMIKARIRHLPVVGDKKIIALVALEDLVKAHVGALTQELHYLKDYITDLQDAAHD
jgi:IMP dehydrogenase